MNEQQMSKLTALLSMSGLDGAVVVATIAGFFTRENAPLIAVLFIAGPGAIASAILLSGDVKERMIVALLSGFIATSIIMFVAGFGPKLIAFVNLQILSIFGGISIMLIGLMVAGIKLPDKLPIAVMAFGVLLSGILK